MNSFLNTLNLSLLLLLLYSCSKPTENTVVVPELSVSWKIIENKKGVSYQELTLKNESETTLTSDDWELYFSLCRAIKETTSKEVNLVHINGDFHKMVPTASFPDLMKGDNISIRYACNGAMGAASDAPAGLYFIFKGKHIAPVKELEVLPFEEEKQIRLSENDLKEIATPDYYYRKNEALETLSKEDLCPIVPTPAKYKHKGEMVAFDLSSYQLKISSEQDLDKEAKQMEQVLNHRFARTKKADSGKLVELVSLKKQAQEGYYELSVKEDGHVKIASATPAGFYYASQSLRSLMMAYEKELPVVEITDYPRFDFRGLFLDVARNFQSKESILKLLDVMAFYKLNKFHIHLADDEGWRLEIPGLPELTEIGAFRGHTTDDRDYLQPSYGSGAFAKDSANHGSGYYSTADYVEILKYAKERHIQVIPEFDFPGHARAAMKAMEARHARLKATDSLAAVQYLLTDLQDTSVYFSVQNFNDNTINPSLPSTYTFMDKLITETQKMYVEANHTLNLIHLGGDEVANGVWAGSPVSNAQFPNMNAEEIKEASNTYFFKKMHEMLTQKGLEIAGWEDLGVIKKGGKHLPNPTLNAEKITLNSWSNVWGAGTEDLAYLLANGGYKVVLSNATNLYFDFQYEKNPQEPGYYWAAYVNTQNVFEFTPMNLYHSAYMTKSGRIIDDKEWKNKEQLTAKGKKNILGIQGQLWGETVVGAERMEYMLFPRVLALAERAWTPQPKFATLKNREKREKARDEAWNIFANQLGQFEFDKLDKMQGGYLYRIAPPGVVVKEGKVYANTSFPGLTIRYTVDGTMPTEKSPAYQGAISEKKEIRLAAFAPNGRASQVVKIQNP